MYMVCCSELPSNSEADLAALTLYRMSLVLLEASVDDKSSWHPLLMVWDCVDTMAPSSVDECRTRISGFRKGSYSSNLRVASVSHNEHR